ncbi:polyphosphate kinase 2 family protein [Pelagibius sp. Alg239-R121]|uniref:polyphosphate kinase 2 family protein n=1 Tax=Pelagibius sp. Alg239-R121 TaxID=2993448 RepID=UPI0024A70A56|nr:polyphosphate kinase [Pelagibius sp. Alg239-R121]
MSKTNKHKGKLRLSKVDMDQELGREVYHEQLAKLQTKLLRIQQTYLHTGDNAVIAFEGWDAAGKGGTIRRMSAVLDPRGFKVWPIAAPKPHDLARHYLTRFWERLPSQGELAVFDRTWYGRVLVERVEGFAKPREWKRAYEEINDFERLMTDNGTRLVKLFLHVTPEVQLERFEARLHDPMKRWKLSYEDFRNRDSRPAYEKAINDMFERTSTKAAPWHVIPANDKKFARIAAMEIIADCLAKGVDLKPRPLDEKVREEADKLFGAE